MAEKKEKAENTANNESNPQLEAKREKKKSRWTLEICKKYAKRFHTVEEWKIGSPSCFKAAEARGWLKECTALMKPVDKSVKSRPTKPATKPSSTKKSKVG